MRPSCPTPIRQNLKPCAPTPFQLDRHPATHHRKPTDLVTLVWSRILTRSPQAMMNLGIRSTL